MRLETRASPPAASYYDLPDGYTLEERDTSELTQPELAAILDVLERGKAVSVASAKKEIPVAACLVLLKNNGKIVGLGTIKQQREWYARGVQSPEKSNYSFNPKMLELGYVVVADEHQKKHLSGHVLNALLAKNDGDLFATTDHPRMKETLRKRGFVQRGKEWRGKRGVLSLWLRSTAPS